jgi:hypothetical protein
MSSVVTAWGLCLLLLVLFGEPREEVKDTSEQDITNNSSKDSNIPVNTKCGSSMDVSEITESAFIWRLLLSLGRMNHFQWINKSIHKICSISGILFVMFIKTKYCYVIFILYNEPAVNVLPHSREV